MKDVDTLIEAIKTRPIFEVINSELALNLFGCQHICPHCMDETTDRQCMVNGSYINRVPKNFYVIIKAIELWRFDFFLMKEFLKRNINGKKEKTKIKVEENSTENC